MKERFMKLLSKHDYDDKQSLKATIDSNIPRIQKELPFN